MQIRDAGITMDFEFDELKREFLEEAEGKVREIESLARTNGNDAARQRALYLTHQLKGAGGSYGFATISTEAASLEAELEAGKIGDAVASRIERLREVIEMRKAELSSTSS